MKKEEFIKRKTVRYLKSRIKNGRYNMIRRSIQLLLTTAAVVIQGMLSHAAETPGKVSLDGTSVMTGSLYISSPTTGIIFPDKTKQQSASPITLPSWRIYEFAGTGTSGYSGDGGISTAAMISSGRGIDFDSAGNVYIADTSNHCVRKVTRATSVISTVAGVCTSSGFSGDGGPATSAQLYKPYDIAVSTGGDIYIADNGNHRIRKVSASTGYISTIVGNGTGAFSGDGGDASLAKVNGPYGVMLMPDGDLVITDSINQRIRRINHATNIITTIAGNGVGIYAGDGGLATSASIKEPYDTARDSAGNIYIGDYLNDVIRKIDSAGIISTVVGTSTAGYNGDGIAATAAQLNRPHAIAFDSKDNLYISDRDNYRVRRVDSGTGIITTVAGRGTAGYAGYGGTLSSNAILQRFRSVAVDASDNIFILDSDNYRVREMIPTAPMLALSSATVGHIEVYDGDATEVAPTGSSIIRHSPIYNTLSIDSVDRLFLNYARGTGGIFFGSGAQSVVGSIDASGNASFSGSSFSIGGSTFTVASGTATAANMVVVSTLTASNIKSNGAAALPGMIGETLTAYTNSAVSLTGANEWTDGVSKTLDAGIWLVTGYASFSTNGATVGNGAAGLSTTSGNSAPSFSNWFYSNTGMYLAGTTVTGVFTLTSTATVYMKVLCQMYSGATPQIFSSSIVAVRIH